MRRAPSLSSTVVFFAALLFQAGCLTNAALAASGPEPFTGQLTEVDGVQAILSLKHPKLINRDLEKLMTGVPETAALRMTLASLTPYGHPGYSEIAAGSNIGVAVLNLYGADLKPKSPVYIGFAKLKEGGKLWTVLAQGNLALQKHGDWVLIAKNDAEFAKLKSPEAVIAYLEKPQSEDIRFWGRTSPELLAGVKALILPPFKSKFADFPPEKRKTALAYIDAIYSLLQQLHSVEASLTFDDNGFRMSYAAQFLPGSPLGTFLSYKPTAPLTVAQYVSADALAAFVSRNNPKAFSDLANSVFDTLISVDYPPMAERLKQWKATYAAFTAAIDGGAVGTFDLALARVDGRERIKPRFFFVMSGRVDRQLARSYFRQGQTMNQPISNIFQPRLKSSPGIGAFKSHSQFTENAISADGILFDSLAVSNTLNGKEISGMTQYYGVVDGNVVMADSATTLEKYLPALRTKAMLANRIPIPEDPDEYNRVTLNGGNLVDFLATAAKLNLNDPDVEAQVEDLKAGYASGGPATLATTVGQAKATVTVSVPYKFISASVHLGAYMSAQKLDLLRLLMPNVPPATRRRTTTPAEDSNSVSDQAPSPRDGIYDAKTISVIPTVLYSVDPEYPPFWKKLGIGGEAEVVFTVKTDGSVTDVRVASTSDVQFGEAAALAVSKWRFRPGEFKGRLVPTRMRIPIVFSMDKAK